MKGERQKKGNLLIKNALIITNHNDLIIDNGFVEIEGPVIKEIGSMSNLVPKGETKAIDAGGRVVMPGLVNPHMHLYSSFAKGMKMPRAKNFGEILKRLWWRMDKQLLEEDIYYSSIFGLIEALKSGVTTILDHHASYGFIRGSLNLVARAFDDVGLRGVLCFEVSDRWGKKSRDEAFEENVSFINRDFKTLAGMLGLHASLTLSDESLKMACGIMERYNVGAHIHCAEGMEDVRYSEKNFKKSPIKRLYDAGILREGTLAVHCVHVDEEDVAMLKKSKATVVHSPVSNLNNAVGIAPYLEFCKKGMPVLIGTDGMSAGVSADVKLASMLHKIGASDPQVGWNEVKKSVMSYAPEFSGKLLGIGLGVLKKGAAADIVIYDYYPNTPLTKENFWAHILFGVFSSRARDVVVDGKLKLSDYKLIGLDEKQLSIASQKLAKKFWKRFKP